MVRDAQLRAKKSHKFQRCPHAHHSDELIYRLSKSARYWSEGEIQWRILFSHFNVFFLSIEICLNLHNI